MSGDIDRTSFIGSSIPTEVKICLKNLSKTDENVVTDLLAVIKLHLLQDDQVETKFQECYEKYGDSVMEIYPGLLKIAQSAIRQPQYSLSQKDFIKDLTDMNLPKKFHGALKDLIFGAQRSAIDAACTATRPRYPDLDSFRWRVDVAISSGSLNRVLEPAILMEMKTSDGKTQSFEVSKEKFHELRFAVAHVLKQMQQLEKRSVLQIKS